MSSSLSNRTSSILLQEPFRLFFPTATLVSIIGVSLWPLVYAGWLPFYPGEAHARLMIEGFVAGFAIGFLTTAFPKEIECPPLTGIELSVIYLAYLGTVTCHSLGHILAGDILFLTTWTLLLCALVIRFLFFRKDLPIPGFIVALLGIMSGLTGVTLLILYRLQPTSELTSRLGTLLLNESFILGPILGVGSFLFAHFFNSQNTVSIKNRWYRSTPSTIVLSLLIYATFFLQIYRLETAAPILRAVLVVLFLFLQAFEGSRLTKTGPLSILLFAALGSLTIGILISGFFSHTQVAFKHLLFISGYGLLILTIATRVIGGHSGKGSPLFSRKKPLYWILGFVLMAAATRVIADLIPTIRVSHHIYASLCWIVSVSIWAVAVMRYITTVDPEP